MFGPNLVISPRRGRSVTRKSSYFVKKTVEVNVQNTASAFLEREVLPMAVAQSGSIVSQCRAAIGRVAQHTQEHIRPLTLQQRIGYIAALQ